MVRGMPLRYVDPRSTARWYSALENFGRARPSRTTGPNRTTLGRRGYAAPMWQREPRCDLCKRIPTTDAVRQNARAWGLVSWFGAVPLLTRCSAAPVRLGNLLMRPAAASAAQRCPGQNPPRNRAYTPVDSWNLFPARVHCAGGQSYREREVQMISCVARLVSSTRSGCDMAHIHGVLKN